MSVVDELQSPGSTSENLQDQDLAKLLADSPFLQQAHIYIRSASSIVRAAEDTLTSSYVRPIEYSEQYDLLEDTKKNFEEFRDLIDHTPQLPAEITLSREIFRLKAQTAIIRIDEVKECISNFGFPCRDMVEKFRSLSGILEDLQSYCRIKN